MNEITRRRFIEAASLAAVAPHFAATAEAAGQQGSGQERTERGGHHRDLLLAAGQRG
jgi:hypothetical protein